MEVFNLFRKSLVAPSVLRLPRQGLRFSVDTDVCENEIGSVLFQTHEDGKRYLLGICIQQLRPAVKNYSSVENSAYE